MMNYLRHSSIGMFVSENRNVLANSIFTFTHNALLPILTCELFSFESNLEQSKNFVNIVEIRVEYFFKKSQ